MAEPYRAAVYYVPAADDMLWQTGCIWLGREPETGATLAQPDVPEIESATASPRRYGFHATLKPPMLLRGSLESFLAGVEELARRQKPFALPRLEVSEVGSFLALCLETSSPEMQALADACVAGLDVHRAPEDEAARRKRGRGRAAREQENIERWGYPYVFKDWRFHMTLTESIPNNPLRGAAEAFFAPALEKPRMVESIAVFAEAQKGAPFALCRRFRLGA